MLIVYELEPRPVCFRAKTGIGIGLDCIRLGEQRTGVSLSSRSWIGLVISNCHKSARERGLQLQPNHSSTNKGLCLSLRIGIGAKLSNNENCSELETNVVREAVVIHCHFGLI